ncbi:MAG: hypothetical protein ISR65_11630 [Bacteriovoracaceae bacterium]|nr:hypothetical protein [Bacteriovoracaceae bacterium]
MKLSITKIIPLLLAILLTIGVVSESFAARDRGGRRNRNGRRNSRNVRSNRGNRNNTRRAPRVNTRQRRGRSTRDVGRRDRGNNRRGTSNVGRRSRDNGRRDNRNIGRRRRNYRRNRHVPYRRIQSPRRRFKKPHLYHVGVPRRYIAQRRWVRYILDLIDGYHYYDGYPYFVYNGYRHRYSDLDYCNYDLVDSNNYSVRRSYTDYTCNMGYDLCSDRRDDLNDLSGQYRFFCSERLSDDYIWD